MRRARRSQPIGAAVTAFVPVPPGRRLKLRTAHASLTEWEHDGQGWRLLRYNDAAHLAGLPAETARS